MAAIITNKFRINNAEQFVESFSESAPTAYYLFIGRPQAWSTDVDVQGNSINELTLLHQHQMTIFQLNITIMMNC